jgi:hypothetical protein
VLTGGSVMLAAALLLAAALIDWMGLRWPDRYCCFTSHPRRYPILSGLWGVFVRQDLSV